MIMNKGTFLLLAAAMLASSAVCSLRSGDIASIPARAEAYWPERSMVFLADAQVGVVRAFDVRRGIVPLGQFATPNHVSVRALSLDSRTKQLWVLEAGALSSQDAVTLATLRRWPAPSGIELTGLERDDEGAPIVVSANGQRYRATPESLALEPVWNEPRLAALPNRRR